MIYAEKSKEQVFTATTLVKPISSFDEINYKAFSTYLDLMASKQFKNKGINQPLNNILVLRNINREYLLSKFVENHNGRKILIKSIKKFNLIKRENYTNQSQYNISVEKLASKINLIPVYDKVEEKIIVYYTLKFKVKDKELWQEFLKYTYDAINEDIRTNFINTFDQLLEGEKRFIKFQLQDIESKIKNLKAKYNLDILSQLSFLTEQAQLARKLGLADKQSNEIISSKIYDSDIFDASRIDSNHYLRGYEMIEEQISIIKNRKNVEKYLPGFSLLSEQKRQLTMNKDLERLQKLFDLMPIKSNDFKSAIMLINSTSFTSDKKSIISTIIKAFLIGFLIGVLYVIISDAIRGRLKINLST